jgi:hypothetical protein
MGTIHKVQKIISSEAILIESPEEEEQVRVWLAEFFLDMIDGLDYDEAKKLADAEDLEPLKSDRIWFMRDENQKGVYMSPDKDFNIIFEKVNTSIIPPLEEASFKLEN